MGVFDEPSIEKTCVVVGLQRVFDGEVVCGHPPPESKLQCSRKEVRGKLIISFKASRDTAQDPGLRVDPGSRLPGPPTDPHVRN